MGLVISNVDSAAIAELTKNYNAAKTALEAAPIDLSAAINTLTENHLTAIAKLESTSINNVSKLNNQFDNGLMIKAASGQRVTKKHLDKAAIMAQATIARQGGNIGLVVHTSHAKGIDTHSDKWALYPLESADYTPRDVTQDDIEYKTAILESFVLSDVQPIVFTSGKNGRLALSTFHTLVGSKLSGSLPKTEWAKLNDTQKIEHEIEHGNKGLSLQPWQNAALVEDSKALDMWVEKTQ